ncbi:MAG TPA: sodium:solute symporter family protein [Tepidisphaeraceae bacterium]|jgi:SSS family solute:Na+ symporter|nr:sodium:solute symporter family protein [Tepidisphaeraceae bacterium]
MTPLDYALVVGFLAAMAVGGLWISRLIKDSDDFFVAGRELTPFILAATITATNLSMFHFVGMGGIAYQNGVSIIWQNWTGCIALVMSGCLVLPIMRRLRIRSVPEFLEMRYHRGLRTLVGAFWGIRLCVYLGLLLYLAATAAIVITGWNNYAGWLLIFSLVSVLYSTIGGAWAVAIMDSAQFLIMLAGALIVFPIAMHLAGGIPNLIEYFRTASPKHITLVPQSGGFNYVFISSIMLLGFKWASIDQAILQRAFGARSPRVGAKGMVLSAVITVPMAFLWILPGLAVARLHPDAFDTPDKAIPWLLSTYLPIYAKGLLGFVLCGLVAAQISTITADVNSVATLFTSDVYRTLKKHEPTQRQLLLVVRISSLACGAFMLVMAWLLQYDKSGAVNINLVVVGILDMPLFIVTVVYGLTWRRINWQGAVAGFVGGGIAGVASYFILDTAHARISAPIIGATAALIITPIVALLFAHRHREESDQIWQKPPARGFEVMTPDQMQTVPAGMGLDAVDAVEEEAFHLVPRSAIGKVAMVVMLVGFLVFTVGILSAMKASPLASPLAVSGMLATLLGGLVRVYVD